MTVYELAELKIKEAYQRENSDWDGKILIHKIKDYENCITEIVDEVIE